jgi:hypothetical protein
MMMQGDILDKLHKGHEYKYSGPAFGLSAQLVWEAMQKECISYCPESGRCASIYEGAPDICAFATCPLLEEARDA